MRQIVCKCFTILGIAVLALVLTACGGEGPTTIIDDNDDDNTSEACSEDCSGDTPYCSDGSCVECTDAGAHCEQGEGCVGGECITDDTSCTADQDCPFDSQMCVEGGCEFVPRQCTDVGQDCEPGAPTRDGFSCEDLGRGAQCYRTCNRYRVCADGSQEFEYDCSRGSACVSGPEVINPVCQPSECEDFFDTEAGCAAMMENSPEELANGKHCVEIGGGNYACAGAGDAPLGANCDETTDCSEGLTCVSELPQHGFQIPTTTGALGNESFCAEACDSDDMCSDGQKCIGDDNGVFDGVGFCGDGCEAFGFDEEDECGEDLACIPVSTEDGVCFRETSRQRDYYEECTSEEQCPDSAACLALFEGTPQQCYPLCDPTLDTQEERNATCPTPDGEDRLLGGDCLDLATATTLPLDTAIGSGVCFESCMDSDEWGTDGCSMEDGVCQPAGDGVGWCEPGGSGEAGDSCSDETECSDGLYCDPTGDGSGTCRSYCQPDEQTNSDLGCEAEEACIAMSGFDNLGECRLPCDPGEDGTDPNCPTGQQNCYRAGDSAYCGASGDLSHEAECGDPSVQNCAPGLVCARSGETLNEVLSSPFASTDDEDGTCRMTCEPFTGSSDESGCPKGYACSPVTPDGESQTAGHCVPALDPPMMSMQACGVENQGMMCDENSFCIDDQGSTCGPDQAICLQFCDYPTQSGCSEGATCEEGFQDGPLFGFLGICR